MRKYDIAYVPRGPARYLPLTPVEDMGLDELKRKYIKTCGKANGDISVCSKCQNPCNEGKRAIQLLANEIYNDPPIPLYGGKTLIEKAREENLKRREEEPKKKRQYIRMENWWEDSLASGDQVKWLMSNLGLTRTQAKKKIYQYKYAHGMKQKISEPKIKTEVQVDSNIESKLESLMRKQEEHKKKMDEYMALYHKEKEEYDKLKEKTDILCNAMDILND